MSRVDHAVRLIKFVRAMAAKTKTKHYYSAHYIATRVSFGMYKHQCTTVITTMWTESSLVFPESYTVGLCARVMADNGETKGLITPPPSFCTIIVHLCHCMIVIMRV